MSNIDEKLKYHIRFKGRILGPYSVKQLVTLRDKGQLTPSLEVSADGANWQPAAALTEVFPAAVITDLVKTTTQSSRNITDGASAGTLDGTDAVWHYTSDDRQFGPVTQNEIQELMYTGELTSLNLVWKEGMSDWVAVGDHADFHSITSPNGRPGDRTSRKKPVSPESQGLVHLLDPLLNQIRRNDADAGGLVGNNRSIEVGKYASYIAIGLIVLLHFGIAVKRQQFGVFLVGAAFGVFGIATQFASIKCFAAVRAMIRGSRHRMSTTALLDSITVISMAGGVVIFLASVFVAVESHNRLSSGSSYLKYPALLMGLALAIVCIRGATVMLNPAWAGITISDEVGPGENAIAHIFFLLIVPWYFVPSAFVVVSIVGVVLSGAALATLLLSSTINSEMVTVFIDFALLYMGVQAFPIILYVYFLYAYIAIDLVRSILILPDRIDRLGSRLGQVNSRAENGSPPT